MITLTRCAAVAALTAWTVSALAQTSPFDLDAYRQFLSSHQNLSASGLQAMHPAGQFAAGISSPGSEPVYLDTIRLKYQLTPFELAQIENHGFVVTSRLARHTFVEALGEIYHDDLPVFVSTDAILQAIHNSYDNILKGVELSILLPELQSALGGIRAQLTTLESRYGQIPAMQAMLRDVDLFCSVPLMLLGRISLPFYSDNIPRLNELMGLIGARQPQSVSLFGTVPRFYDFSQFTVRGHYTTDSLLARYFKAMIWLGRTEFSLLAPEGALPPAPFADVQRQMIDAALIAEAAREGGALQHIQKMNGILTFMVGESDNVTIDSLLALFDEAGIGDPSVLLDSVRTAQTQELLASKSYAGQRIISQILMTDPFDPDQVRPASAFLLLGQRFVIDSYITGNVVYDKILHEGQKVARMLPSTLDVLFALGNNAAGKLLAPELEAYHYAPNAAAMRYLVDSYGDEFWSASMFNAWLAILRTLNPPESKSGLPQFMTTAAWWQEKMNTQLASWAQLRHDNLLYAKQSYTPGIICSYPESYVEPVPEFFDAVVAYANLAAGYFGALGDSHLQEYFLVFGGVADTLRQIAQKELSGIALDSREQVFLRSMLVSSQVCGMPYSGWYPKLFYHAIFIPGDPTERATDFTVADVHTAPTDASGSPVGWVLHVGTGPVDMAVLCTTLPDGRYHAFVGPVSRYYEHLATGFKRLTDEEWALLYSKAPSFRPDFVNLYLASEAGESLGPGPSLTTGVDASKDELPAGATLHPNYPNPFNATTVIPFTVGGTAGDHQVGLRIYNVRGQLVKSLLAARLPRGHYTTVWEGTTNGGGQAASGIYLCRLDIDGAVQVRKLVLLR